jgi:hypothetical protein
MSKSPPEPPNDPKPKWWLGMVKTPLRAFHKYDSEKKKEPRQDRAARFTANATVFIAIFTAVTVCVGVLQWSALRSTDDKIAQQVDAVRDQLKLMSDQTGAMQGQLRMLQQQVIDAREMQRAFITASDYKITKIVGGDANQWCWRFQPVISNAGGSPTVELRYMTQIVFVALRRPGEQGSAWGMILAPTDPDAEFKRFSGWGGALLGPKQNLPDTPANDRICLTKDDSAYIFAPERAYARGVIHYRDRYPGTPEHITKYCFWIRAIEDAGGWKPEPALCSHWNCADEECERDKDAYTAEVAERFKWAGQTIEEPFEFRRH